MNSENKPPDKYRTVKCSLNSIFKDKNYYEKLFDATNRTHQLVIHTYQFLRLWILDKYRKNSDIPIITEDTIYMAFKALIKESSGPKPKGSNLELLNEFNKFYEKKYKKLGYYDKIDGKNLSQILNYMKVDMITNIENNIKLNFISYLKRFVNASFKSLRKLIYDSIEEYPKQLKKVLREDIDKDIYDIKQDLINNTLNSRSIHHKWILENRNKILPTIYDNSYEFDVKNHPQKYFKYMIHMCQIMEEKEMKMFQFFPLRTDATVKFIPIDTKTIVELFIDEDKNKYLTDIEGYKYELWNTFFNLDNPIFKQSNYSFDYRISTDCFSVSIQLLHSSFIDSETLKKLNMKNKKKEIKENCKNMTQQEKEEYKNKIAKDKKQEEINKKLKSKEIKDKMKKEFKNLPKEEQIKVKQTIDKKKLEKYIEFPYLEDLNDTKLNQLKKSNWVCVDPGKRVLFYMKNAEGKRLRYTNKTHLKRTKRLKYQRLLQNYKRKQNISKIENELSSYNSKSVNYKKFKKFIKKKNELNKILLEKYQNEIFRKYKWYGYINRKKAEIDLIRDIKNTFGQDVNIIQGDWSIGKAMRGMISSPNLGLKRKLAEYYPIYNLDEFRTSCINHKTETLTENIYLPDKKGKSRKIHSILTYQTENKRLGCINRDENSVNNMIKLVKYYFEYKDRPEVFKRGIQKIPTPKKSRNRKASNGIKPVTKE
ncbi:hypothetical protein [Chlorella virus XW01]|nr:hypothetical protein [Chlorella virus XW01]